MFKVCPNCQGRMVSQADGWFCLECGRTTPSHALPTADRQPKVPDYDPIPTPNSSPYESMSSNHSREILNPQPIIKSHAESHSQRRLQNQIDQLESTPELASPLDPAHELEAPDPVQEIEAAALPERLSPPGDTPESIKPFQPSTYLVSATEPLSSRDTPRLSPEAQLLAQARSLSKQSSSPKLDQAHQKADAVLAAASQSSKKTHSFRTPILVGLSLLILGGGLIAAWIILKPASPPSSQSTPTQTPTQQPAASKEPAQRDAQRKSDLNSIAIGLEAYHKATGAYPVGSDISILGPLEKTSPPYISHINLDPSSTDGSSIKYGYVSDGSSFTLSAALENAQDVDSTKGLYIVRNRLP